MTLTRTGYLRTAVFVSGMCVMVAEMAAPRLLAPAFGTTQLIWTNIIGTVLAAMTAGAFVGGRLADRWPSERAFARVLVIAGLFLAAVPTLSRTVLPRAAAALVAQQAGSFLLSLLVICAFFAVPVFFLGMISPWAIRLAGHGRSDLGRIAGILSGLTALGSIAGTFLASLVLIPGVGTRSTLLTAGALLIATGGWRAWGTPGRVPAAAAAAMLLVLPTGPVKTDTGQVFSKESLYQYVQVVIDDRGWTSLTLDEGLGVQSLKPPTGYLTRAVWDALAAVPALATEPGDALDVLILGLAGGTTALQIDQLYRDRPSVRIDGVELDPVVLEAGRQFFELDSIASLETHFGDGRVFLAGDHGPYDVIIADAYRGFYVPFHMATREFYAAARTRLKPGGVLAINLAAPSAAGALLASFEATLGDVFPHVARFEIRNTGAPFSNFVLLGSRDMLSPPAHARLPGPISAHVGRAMRASWRAYDEGAEEGWILRDDRAPVEFLTDQLLAQTLLSGGR